MVVYGQIGCIRAKCLYSCKVVELGQKLFDSGKVVVFGQNGCIWAKVVVFVQSGCPRAKWLYLGKVVAFRQTLFYSGKMVVFGHIRCIRESGCIWGKVVVIEQNGCN